MERTQEQTRQSDAPVDAPLPLDVQPYDRRKLSYANTFENPLQRITIQTIELLTARLRILRRIRKLKRKAFLLANLSGNRHWIRWGSNY